MKKSKKSEKSLLEMDDLLSKMAEEFLYEEIKKDIMSNPELVSRFVEPMKGLGKGSVEVE